ncbi:MAG: GSCFA domain-containing protein [Bacteroidota bacterium]
MKFRTEIEPGSLPFAIGHRNHLLMLGSCFTSSIGDFFSRYLFDVTINPFGTIYNPMSVARNLEALLERKVYTHSDLYRHEDTWLSFDHYTAFSGTDREEVLSRINEAFIPATEALRRADRLLLTFGTAWLYRLKATGQIVCNCHKVPASQFERFRLDQETIVKVYKSLISRLLSINPDLRILFTVSPVRHWKDGAHGNQLSKAVLLLAIEELVSSFPEHLAYFPAYELLLDDLRDYRFFDADLLHPSDEAIEYIWEKFSASALDAESRNLIGKLEPLLLGLAHRPSDPHDPRHLALIERLEKNAGELKKAFPAARWEKLKVR